MYNAIEMTFSREEFASNMSAIVDDLKQSSSQIIRFIFTVCSGKMMSLTMSAKKVIVSPPDKLLSLLVTSDCILYPDISTAFNDPCSVQENYCLLCSMVKKDFSSSDDRMHLMSKNIKMHSTNFMTFTPSNDGVADVDQLHDFRSEIVLEGMKAGLDINSHYTTDNISCTISFESSSSLALADSIQKMKFLITSIAGSYGKSVSFSGSQNSLISRSTDGQCIIINTLEENPYSVIKKLFS